MARNKKKNCVEIVFPIKFSTFYFHQKYFESKKVTKFSEIASHKRMIRYKKFFFYVLPAYFHNHICTWGPRRVASELKYMILINMFPSIDNNMGIASVRKYLVFRWRGCENFPTDCLIEALELCLSCDNSVLTNTNYLQTDGTAQGPHMSCSYPDIAMAILSLHYGYFRLSKQRWWSWEN